jgi:hypothetical protein
MKDERGKRKVKAGWFELGTREKIAEKSTK